MDAPANSPLSSPVDSPVVMGVVLLAPLTLAWVWRRGIIGPGSLRRTGVPMSAGPDAAGAAVRLLMLGFGLYAWQVIASVAVLGAMGAGGDVRAQGQAALLVYGLVTPAAIGVALAAVGRAGLVRRPVPEALKGLGTLALAWPTLTAVSVFGAWLAARMQGHPPDPIAHDTLRAIVNSGEPWRWGLVAGAVLGAPVVEEVLYRGLLQGALVRGLGPGWPAATVTATLFALVHVGSVPPHALATLFTLGLALGVLTLRSGRLLPAMVAHAAFNAVNIAIAMANGGGAGAGS